MSPLSPFARFVALAFVVFGLMLLPATVVAAPRLHPAADAHLDVASVRGIHAAARRSTTTASTRSLRTAAVAGTGTPAGKSLDMRILVLGATGDEPTFHWWTDTLRKEGVPFDAVVATSAPEITATTLRAGADHGRYQAVVLADGALAYTPDGGATWASALSGDEWAALAAYEREFAVREVDAYVYPQAAYGLQLAAPGADQGGTTAQLTAAGRSFFTDLVGPVPIEKMTYGYPATPIPGSSFTPLVQSGDNALVGSYTRDDGTEAVVSTVDGNEWALHSHLLVHGMLEWATRGVHLGLRRDWLGIDVDDIFLGDDRWTPGTHTLDTDHTVRMTAADVDRVRAWQQSSGIRLNMLFNGDGAAAGDPLTEQLLAHKDEFRWTSHTWSHENLDTVPIDTLHEQIWKNIDWAHEHGIAIDETELTTGEHSGLNNPRMAEALADTGIRWIGSDASRTPDQAPLGPALTVPRHPTGIYYNVGTRAEQLDEYDYLNYELCHGTGNPGCLGAPVDWDGYVDNEATIILRHILDNDPRPHYVHQSNLAEDGTMYPVVDEVLRRYHSYLKPELVQPSTRQSGEALQRMATWNAAVAAGKAGGTIQADGSVVVTTTAPVAAPVTGGTVGETYGGERSGWTDASSGTTPVGGTTPGPATPADPTPAPAPTSYADLVAGDGAFSLWHLDASGATIADALGRHDGAWRNGPPALAEGVAGQAASFDGGPAYGEVNGVTAPASAYTLEAWIRTTDSTDGTLVEHGAAGALALVGGRLAFRHVDLDVRAGWPVEPGLWYHVAGTWDGSTARLYVNGHLVASGASATRPSGAATLYLGRGSIAPNLGGRLDEVAYYDHALTAAQVDAHAYAGHHPAVAAAAAPSPAPAAPASSPSSAPSSPAAASSSSPAASASEPAATGDTPSTAPAPEADTQSEAGDVPSLAVASAPAALRPAPAAPSATAAKAKARAQARARAKARAKARARAKAKTRTQARRAG